MFTNVFSITTNVHVHKDIHKHEILRSRIIFYFVSIPFTQQYAIAARIRTARLFFAVTVQSCYSEKELSCSGPNSSIR